MIDDLIECVFCGDEYDPKRSDADRPRDYCSAEHQRLAFHGGPRSHHTHRGGHRWPLT